MDFLQWAIIAILIYVVYYLVNKYEKKADELTRLIELNRENIENNKKNIEKNKADIEKIK